MNRKALLLSGAAFFLLAGAGCSSKPAANPEDTVLPTPTPDAVSAMPTTTPSDTPYVAKPEQKNSGSATTPSKSAGSANTSATKDYTNALATYRGSGYYFQFVSCHGNPGSLSMKKGIKYMVDNRDNVSHRISVAGKIITLGSYGYAILTAPTTVGTYYVTCDGGGAAKIMVQK